MEDAQTTPPVNTNPDFQEKPVVTTTVSNERPKRNKKLDIKKPVIIIAVLVVVAFGIYQVMKMTSSSSTQQQNYSITEDSTQVLLPTALPVGFSQEGEVNKLEGDGGKITYTANYTNGTGRISFTQSNSPSSGCVPPRQDVATSLADYQEFNPNGATEGCSFTLAKGTQNESNIYRWTNGATQFVVLIYNARISESDITTLVDSLQKTSI